MRKHAAAVFARVRISESEERRRKGDERNKYARAVAEKPPANSRINPKSQVINETKQNGQSNQLADFGKERERTRTLTDQSREDQC